jgi:DNA-binding LacI/PurR family transcriptional regulator/serine phosphatase RsbU (regulator of sigma subunit)
VNPAAIGTSFTAPPRARRRIGVLLDALYDEYASMLVTAFEHEARERDLDLYCFAGGSLHSLAGHELARNHCYSLVSARSLDGLVVLSLTASSEVAEAFLARYPGLPKVTVGHTVPGVPVVVADNAAGMREAVVHLISAHGRRRLVFLRGPAANPEAQTRFQAYRDALRDFGLDYDPALVQSGEFTTDMGRRAMRELMDRHVDFDAVVGANDFSVLGALEVLRERDISVPHQVAVIGFDDAELARGATPTLSTVRQPYFELAANALDVLNVILDGGTAPERLVLGSRLVRRRSCGCLSDGAPSDVPPSLSAFSEPFREAFERMRPQLGRELVTAATRARANVERGFEIALLDALGEALDHVSDRRLIERLDQVLSRTIEAGGDVLAWQHTLSELRRRLLPAVRSDARRWMRLEDVWQRLRVLVADAVDREQRGLRTEAEHSASILTDTSESLITSFDLESLPRSLADRLPALGIRSCFIALYDSWGNPAPSSRLIVAYDRGQLLEVPPGGLLFDTLDLAPPRMLAERRRAMVIEPLFFENAQLGFALLELGPRRRVVYELLRELVSAALHGAELMRRVAHEAAAREKAETQRLESELAIATRIQTSILPRDLSVQGLEIAAMMRTATEVGGDYYDVLPTAGGCWIGIGDVAGHGLGSGLVMMMLQSVVSALVRQNPEAAPRELLRVVNAVLYDNVRTRLQQDEHATLSLIRYSADGELSFAGAHEDMLVLRSATGRVEAVPTLGTWVGATRDIDEVTQDSQLRLSDGDVLLLYTDGVIEAQDAQGERFGIERLSRQLERHGEQPALALRDLLAAAVQDFMAEQRDDLALLVARYRASA